MRSEILLQSNRLWVGVRPADPELIGQVRGEHGDPRLISDSVQVWFSVTRVKAQKPFSRAVPGTRATAIRPHDAPVRELPGSQFSFCLSTLKNGEGY